MADEFHAPPGELPVEQFPELAQEQGIVVARVRARRVPVAVEVRTQRAESGRIEYRQRTLELEAGHRRAMDEEQRRPVLGSVDPKMAAAVAELDEAVAVRQRHQAGEGSDRKPATSASKLSTGNSQRVPEQR